MPTLTLLLALACSGDTAHYDDPDQCRAMDAGADRDECWAAVAPQLFREDPVAAQQTIIDQVQDDKVRDFIWLTVTREVDPGSTRWCELIQDPALAERCKVLVSRPHLHRALQEEHGGAAGQPPPGGRRGGGPPPAGPPPAGGPRGGPPPGAGAPPPGAPRQGPGDSPPPPSEAVDDVAEAPANTDAP